VELKPFILTKTAPFAFIPLLWIARHNIAKIKIPDQWNGGFGVH
jgi:hypothetical protein